MLLGNAPRCDCRNILRSAHDGKHIGEITADADARLTDVIFSAEIVVVKDAAHGLVVGGETVVSKRIQTILVQGCRLMFRAPGGIRQFGRFFDPIVYIRIFSCLLRINRIIQILGCKELIRGQIFACHISLKRLSVFHHLSDCRNIPASIGCIQKISILIYAHIHGSTVCEPDRNDPISVLLGSITVDDQIRFLHLLRFISATSLRFQYDRQDLLVRVVINMDAYAVGIYHLQHKAVVRLRFPDVTIRITDSDCRAAVKIIERIATGYFHCIHIHIGCGLHCCPAALFSGFLICSGFPLFVSISVFAIRFRRSLFILQDGILCMAGKEVISNRLSQT